MAKVARKSEQSAKRAAPGQEAGGGGGSECAVPVDT